MMEATPVSQYSDLEDTGNPGITNHLGIESTTKNDKIDENKPQYGYIKKSAFGVILNEREYPQDHNGDFVSLLDATKEEFPSVESLTEYLMNHDEETEIKKIGRKRYIIRTKDKTLNDLIKTMPFITNHFTVGYPSATTEFVGVLKTDTHFDVLEELTNLDILEQEINSIHYICRRDSEGKLNKTNSVRINFKGTNPRQAVYIGLRKFRLVTYIPKVRICSACHRYGHLQFSCKAQPRCHKCGKVDCTASRCPQNSPKCLACSQNGHWIGDKNCALLRFLSKHALDLRDRKIMVRDLNIQFRNMQKQPHTLRSRKHLYSTIVKQPLDLHSPSRLNFEDQEQPPISSSDEPHQIDFRKRATRQWIPSKDGRNNRRPDSSRQPRDLHQDPIPEPNEAKEESSNPNKIQTKTSTVTTNKTTQNPPNKTQHQQPHAPIKSHTMNYEPRKTQDSQLQRLAKDLVCNILQLIKQFTHSGGYDSDTTIQLVMQNLSSSLISHMRPPATHTR